MAEQRNFFARNADILKLQFWLDLNVNLSLWVCSFMHFCIVNAVFMFFLFNFTNYLPFWTIFIRYSLIRYLLIQWPERKRTCENERCSSLFLKTNGVEITRSQNLTSILIIFSGGEWLSIEYFSCESTFLQSPATFLVIKRLILNFAKT